MADVFKQNVECLKELDTNITPGLLPQDVQEEGKHVLLQEEAESRNIANSSQVSFLIIYDFIFTSND